MICACRIINMWCWCWEQIRSKSMQDSTSNGTAMISPSRSMVLPHEKQYKQKEHNHKHQQSLGEQWLGTPTEPKRAQTWTPIELKKTWPSTPRKPKENMTMNITKNKQMTYYEEWKLSLCNLKPAIAIATSIQITQGKKMSAQVLPTPTKPKKARPQTPIEPKRAQPWIMAKTKLNLQLTFEVFIFELPSKVLPKLPSFYIWPFMKTQHTKKSFSNFFSLFPSFVAWLLSNTTQIFNELQTLKSFQV